MSEIQTKQTGPAMTAASSTGPRPDDGFPVKGPTVGSSILLQWSWLQQYVVDPVFEDGAHTNGLSRGIRSISAIHMLLCITLSVVSVTETKQSPSVTQVKLSFVQSWQKHCNAVASGTSVAAAASMRRSSRGRGVAATASIVPLPLPVARPGPAAALPQQASPRPGV